MSRSFEPEYFAVTALRKFAENVFVRLGVSEKHSKIAADVLIEADLRGFDSHGLARLFPCVSRIQKGLIAAKPEIEIKWLSSSTGYCSGGNGIGMVVAWYAMEACLQRAKEHGAAFLTVNRSNHFGIAGYYSSMALDFDMIGIAMCNASPRVVPTGGSTGILGTNPMSVAIPCQGAAPFILDMSTSAVSSGKIDVAVRKGTEIPDGWVYPSVKPFLDSEGVVPMSVLQYPLGGEQINSGYKGYGLGLMIDILSGVLSGSNCGSGLAASKKAQEADIGHFFGALQLEGFNSLEKISEKYKALVQDVKSSPLEPGAENIYIPGEPEVASKAEKQKSGIPILPPVLKKLKKIGADLKLSFPE
jgi:LDH2 family malate/lactate/ureidoglycolate dehydrogenase